MWAADGSRTFMPGLLWRTVRTAGWLWSTSTKRLVRKRFWLRLLWPGEPEMRSARRSGPLAVHVATCAQVNHVQTIKAGEHVGC